MRTRAEIECWLTDMDGVLVHENRPIPGAAELLAQWRDAGTPFLVLTNNPIFTPRDLSARLRRSGLDVPEERIWTSALATADFLRSQLPGGTAFVIGEAGLTTALHEAGYIIDRVAARLRRGRRDPAVLVRGDHQGDPLHQRGRAVHHHEPRSDRPDSARHRPGDGVVRGAHHQGDRQGAVRGRQAESDDVPLGALNRIGAHSETTA